jgi:F-type H+-transporting ATPase subunit a
MTSPIEQFEIHALTPPLFHLAGQPVAFTNSALYMFFAVALAMALTVLAMRPQAIVPGRWQMLAETLYNFISEMVSSAAGEKAKPFFPFIFTIFIFIFACNFLGMIPHSLTVTSHIVVNLALALFIFVVITVTGLVRHGTHFFSLFVPHGVPVALLPFLMLIEIVSFLVRPFSLSVRLFANMLAGHILLKVFAGMTASLAAAGGLAAIGVLPLALNIAITAFEFFVAALQAYIFAILTAVYLRDALELH